MTAKIEPAEDRAEILVVEDSRTQAEQLRHLLEQHGYGVMVAENGNQGLAVLKERRPTLVITDIIMPEMNGYDLCKRIKSDAETQEIPVILMTSLTSAEDVLEGLACGADNFITKPYSEEYILSSIEKILAGGKLRKSERVRIGVEIMFAGKRRFITADQQQMLSLLISTYEAAVFRNTELTQTQNELRALNERLEDKVEERTAALSQEIVERKQAEASLRESEEKYRRIFENSVVGIFQSTPQGRFITANAAFARMLGYDSAEELLASISDIATQYYVHAEDRRRYRQILEKQGYVENVEFQVRHKDGTHPWVSNSARVFFGQDGAILRYEGIAIDITDRKRAEKEREKLQVQLIQARKMESVGRLAGGVAHDFNNMLSVILGYAEMALQSIDPADDLHEHLTEIRTAAKRSADITRQLLTFARKQTIAPEILDLNAAVEDCLKMLRRLIGEDIDFSWRPGAGLWSVLMDLSQLDQVLANLCVNARDAIPGVGKVTIETDNVTFDAAYCADHIGFVPGEFALLAVSDSGCGMDKKTLDNLFEPFFTTKEVGKGTGLGLATVYGIVKQNNGFINVYSEPGKGTTFRIYLPRHAGEAGEIRAKGPAEIPRGHGETVLLVEDEASILKLTHRILDGLGYNVLVARTPGEAIGLAKEYSDKIYLLITDVVMPEMNGGVLAKHLQALCPDIKTLFMSGYTANVIAHRGVLEKGVNFIQKAFSTEDLAAKVRAVLDTAKT